MLTCCCVGLHNASLVDTVERQYVIGGCYIGYMVIGIATLLEFVSQPCPKNQDLYFCAIGVLMFLAAGILSIKFYRDSFVLTNTEKIVCAKGALSVVNAALYLVCGYFVYQK